MRKQILPLLLCLLTIFYGWSSTPNLIVKDKKTTLLKTDNVELTTNKSSLTSLSIDKKSSKSSLPNSVVKKQKISNTIGKVNTAGILPPSVFSYNNITASKASSLSNFTNLHLNSNLFNQGLYFGFALTIILLNIVCYFIFDETLFALFSGTFAALTANLFFADGLLPLIGIDGVLQPEIIQSTLLIVFTIFCAFFATKYLVVKDLYPKLHQITIPLLITAALLISFAWLTTNTLMTNIANTILFGIVSIYFIVGVLLFSRKNYAKFYVIALFIPLLFSIDFFVLQNFGIDFLFTEIVHLKIAILFEALIISYAILYRMQAVKEEGVLRQTEMRIFLKRQDVMNRNKVEEMIEDIYLENLIMQYDLDGFEIKLLQYISEGKTNAKIARKLKVTENELGEFTKELYQKLEISEQIKEDHRMVDNQPDFIYN